MNKMRYISGFFIGASLISALALFLSAHDLSLRHTRYLDGWLLLCGLLLQIVFHFRKRISFLSFGMAKNWLQVHVYLGLSLFPVFLFHTKFSLPDSRLELLLWLLFLIVFLSGFLGHYLSKAIPSRLDNKSIPLEFERIDTVRLKLENEAAQLAKSSISQPNRRSISQLYLSTIHSFLEKPRNLVPHLLNSNKPINQLVDQIERLERFQDKEGLKTLEHLKTLVVTKNQLDYQYAHQGLLHVWLFVHVPATYGLVIAVLFHVLLMYAFSSGVR